MKTIPSIVMKPHKHHIIPRYKCKELGIEPDFDDNLVDVTREQHALIHWGYKCNDLSPLLEVCNPPQWIIDLIPRGDNRDMWAAQINAKGEIGGIDTSGENNPMYGRTGEKHPMYGVTGKNAPMYGKKQSDHQRRTMSKRMSGENNPKWKGGITNDMKEYRKIYKQSPEGIAVREAYKKVRKAWGASAEGKEFNKKRRQKPEYKAYQKEYKRKYRLKKKLEKQQGVATLDKFL